MAGGGVLMGALVAAIRPLLFVAQPFRSMSVEPLRVRPASNGGLATKALGEESGHARWRIAKEKGGRRMAAQWYVAQVASGKEASTARLCERFVGTPVCEACFAPECEVMWKTGGQWELKRKLLFPGYLFFVTKDVDALNDELRKIPAMARLLGAPCDGATSDVASSAVTDNGTVVRSWRERSAFMPLTADERDWFLAFSDAAHVVRMSEGVIEGDTVKVTRGPLVGREGLIRKIDRHKRRAYLEVTMFGRTIPASVGLEIVRKTA